MNFMRCLFGLHRWSTTQIMTDWGYETWRCCVLCGKVKCK